MFSFIAGKTYRFRFHNYRDEWETRHVVFAGLDYGSNSYYPEPRWFARCWDIERGEPRSFVLDRVDVTTLEECQ